MLLALWQSFAAKELSLFNWQETIFCFITMVGICDTECQLLSNDMAHTETLMEKGTISYGVTLTDSN